MRTQHADSSASGVAATVPVPLRKRHVEEQENKASNFPMLIATGQRSMKRPRPMKKTISHAQSGQLPITRKASRKTRAPHPQSQSGIKATRTPSHTRKRGTKRQHCQLLILQGLHSGAKLAQTLETCYASLPHAIRCTHKLRRQARSTKKVQRLGLGLCL